MSVQSQVNPRLAALTEAGHERVAGPDPPLADRGRRAAAPDRRGLAARRDLQPGDLREGDPRLARLRRRARRSWPARASTREIYRDIAIHDVQLAADVMRPVHDRTDGADGFVSIEVAPRLARDTEGTLEQARMYWERVDRPNVMIKIPGTDEGLPAIEQAIYEGINVNVTLLFSVEAYDEGGRGLHPRPGAPPRRGPATSTCTRSPRSSSRAWTPRSTSAWRSWAAATCRARPPWPTRAPPTSASSDLRRRALRRRCARPARRCSARCGRRPASRTRPTPRRSTSTSWSAPHTVNTMPMPTLLAARRAQRDHRRRRPTRTRRPSSTRWPRPASTWTTSPTSCCEEGIDAFGGRWSSCSPASRTSARRSSPGARRRSSSVLPDELEPAIAEVGQRARSPRASPSASGARTTRCGARPAQPEVANRLGWLTISEPMLEHAADLRRVRGGAARPTGSPTPRCWAWAARRWGRR